MQSQPLLTRMQNNYTLLGCGRVRPILGARTRLAWETPSTCGPLAPCGVHVGRKVHYKCAGQSWAPWHRITLAMAREKIGAFRVVADALMRSSLNNHSARS